MANGILRGLLQHGIQKKLTAIIPQLKQTSNT